MNISEKSEDKQFSDLTNDTVYMENKMKKVKKNKNRFSKSTILDPLDNIYEVPLSKENYHSFKENLTVGHSIIEGQTNMDNSEQTDSKTTTTPTPPSVSNLFSYFFPSSSSKPTNSPVSLDPSTADFADIWLSQELQRDGDPDPDGTAQHRKDRFCSSNPLSNNVYVKDFQYFLKMVEYPTIYIEYYIKKTGIIIGNIFSGYTATDQDKKVIINQLNIMVLLLISIFAVYNWFFLLIFRDSSGKNIDKYDINHRFFEQYSGFLDYLLRFTLYPVEITNTFFTNWLPYGLNYLFKYVTIIWILLFIFIFYAFYYCGQFLVDLYYESLNILFRGLTVSHYGGSNSPAGISYYYINLLIVFSLLTFYFNPVNIFLNIMSMTIFGSLISFVISIMISCYWVSIPGILIPLYLFIYSFFGILIYSKKSFSQTLSDINEFIKNSIFQGEMCPVEESCKNKTLFENILDFLKLIVDLIYKYVFSISFVIILIYSIIDYYKNITTLTLKSNLINITIFLIFIIIGYLNYENASAVLKNLNEISNKKE